VQFFSEACDTLASVSEDGEVFVWRIFLPGDGSSDLNYEILAKARGDEALTQGGPP
jgi:hypothetical protein